MNAYVCLSDWDTEASCLIEWVIMRNKSLAELKNEITRKLLNKIEICSRPMQKYILNFGSSFEGEDYCGAS